MYVRIFDLDVIIFDLEINYLGVIPSFASRPVWEILCPGCNFLGAILPFTGHRVYENLWLLCN